MSLKAGYYGFSRIVNLGTKVDMQLFFDCIDYYVVGKYPERDWSVLMDRFYRRYLKLEELDVVASLLEIVEEEFKKLNTKEAIDFDLSNKKIETDLDASKHKLNEFFDGYFRAFYEIVSSVHYSKEVSGDKFRYYNPLRIAITTMSYVTDFKDIPLSFYDNLPADAKPIWNTGIMPDYHSRDAGKEFEKIGYKVIYKKMNNREPVDFDLYVEGLGSVDVYALYAIRESSKKQEDECKTISDEILQEVEKRQSKSDCIIWQERLKISDDELKRAASLIWQSSTVKDFDVIFFQHWEKRERKLIKIKKPSSLNQIELQQIY